MKTTLGNKRGQSMVEYIIIVVVVALAALAIFGVFGDRLRSIVGGATTELGADQSKVTEANQTGSAAKLKSYEDSVGDGN